MKLNFIKIIAISLIVFAVWACEDDPSSLGIESIPDSDLIQVLEMNSLENNFIQTTDYYSAGYNSEKKDTNWNLGTAIRIHVGKSENIKSSMLIKYNFAFTDSFKSKIKNDSVHVDSTWLELKPKYVVNGESSNFGMTIDRINSSWGSSDFDVDSLNNVKSSITPLNYNVLEQNDTLWRLEVNNDLSIDWMKAIAEDKPELVEGLLFSPTENTDKIYGFYSLHSTNITDGFDEIPNIKIKFHLSGQENNPDTLTFYSIRDVHVLEGELPSDNEGNIYLQGGFPIRANLFFDINKLPKNAIILQANLDLFYDDLRTINGSRSADTVAAIMYSDSLRENFVQSSSVGVLLRNEDEKKYSGNLTSTVQRWNNGEDNFGLYLYITDEKRYLNRVALRGSSFSDPAFRPRLTIKYTKR